MPNNIVFLADSNATYRPCDPVYPSYERKYPSFAPVLSHHFILNSESYAVCHYQAPKPVCVPHISSTKTKRVKKAKKQPIVEESAVEADDSVSCLTDWYDECDHYDYEFEAYVKLSKKNKESNWSKNDKLRKQSRGDPSGYPAWVPNDMVYAFTPPAVRLPSYIDARDFPSFDRIAEIGVEAASLERATVLKPSPVFNPQPLNPRLQRVREAWAAAKHPNVFAGIEDKPDPTPARSASQVRRLIKEGKVKEAREMSDFLTEFTYDAEKKRLRSSSPLPNLEDTIPEHPKSSKYHANKPANKTLAKKERKLSLDSDWEREAIADQAEAERNDLPPRYVLASAITPFHPILRAATQKDTTRNHESFAYLVLAPLLNNKIPETGPSILRCDSVLAVIPPDGGCVLSAVLSLLRLAKPIDRRAETALLGNYVGAAAHGSGMMSADNVNLFLAHIGWNKHYLCVKSAVDFTYFNMNDDSLFYTVSPSGAQGHLCSLLSVNLRSKAKNRRRMICPWFVIRTYTAIMNHQTYGWPLSLPDRELHHPWNWNEDLDASIMSETSSINEIDSNKLQPHWDQNPIQKSLAHALATKAPVEPPVLYEPKHRTKKPAKPCIAPPERKKASSKGRSQAKRKASKKAMLTNICMRHEVQTEFAKPNANGGKSKELNRRRQARKIQFTIRPKAQTSTFSELRDFTEKFSNLVKESVSAQQMPHWLSRVKNFIDDNGRFPRDHELYPKKLALPDDSQLSTPELTMQEVAFKATSSTTIPVISDIQRLACLSVHPTVPANIAANHMLILLGFIRKQGIAHGLTDIFLTHDTPVCQTVRDLAENILTGRAARAALRTPPPKMFGSTECPRLINSRCTASVGQLLLAYNSAPRVALSSAPPINTARIVQDGYVHPNPGGVNAEAMVWARNNGLKLLNGSDNNPYKDNQGHAQMRWFNDLSSLAILNQMPAELSDKAAYTVLHDIGSKREGFLRDLKLVYDTRSTPSNTFVSSCFQEWIPNAEVVQKNDLLTLSAASSQNALPTQAHFPFESVLRRIPDREEQFWRQFNAVKKSAVLDPITTATRSITQLHYSPYIEYFSRPDPVSTLPHLLGLNTGWSTTDFQSINNLKNGQFRDFDRAEIDFDNLPEVDYEINNLVTQVQLLTLRHKRDQAIQGNFGERPGRDPNPDEYIDDDLLDAGDDESLHSGHSDRDPQERPDDPRRLPPNANRQQVGNPANGRRGNRFWARVDVNNQEPARPPPLGAIGVVKLRVQPTNNPTSVIQGNVLREYRRLSKEFMKLLDFRPNQDRTLFISSESFFPDSLLFLLQLAAFFQSLHRASPHVSLELRRQSARRSATEPLTTANDKVFWDDAVELLLGFARMFLAQLWSSMTSDDYDLDTLGVSTFNVYLWIHSIQSVLNSPFFEYIGCCSPDSAEHWDNISAMNNLCAKLTYGSNSKWAQLLTQSSNNNAYLALSRLFQKLTPANLFYFDFTFDMLSWTGRLRSVFRSLPGHIYPEIHQKRAYLDYGCWTNLRCWVLNKNARDGTRAFLRWCNSPNDPLPDMVQVLDVGDEILRLCAPEETIDADERWNAAYIISSEPRPIEFSYFISPVVVPPPGIPLEDVENQNFEARQAHRAAGMQGAPVAAQLMNQLPEIIEEDDDDESSRDSDWYTISDDPEIAQVHPPGNMDRVLIPRTRCRRRAWQDFDSVDGESIGPPQDVEYSDEESREELDEPVVHHVVIRSIEWAYVRLPDLPHINCPVTRHRVRMNYWSAVQTRWRNDQYPSGLFWSTIEERMARIGMNNWIRRMEDLFEAADRILNPLLQTVDGIPRTLTDFIQYPPEGSAAELNRLSMSQVWTEYRSQYPHNFSIPIVMLLGAGLTPLEPVLSVLPLLLDPEIVHFLDAHKLLWLHQARPSNDAPTYLSAGFAPNTQEFQHGIAQAFASLTETLFTAIRQLISQPTPSYSNFISKNKYGCTRELERLMSSRRTENSLHRVHAEKTLYNNSTLSQGLESLLHRLLSIQPVITSRPWDVVPCDVEYNRSHPPSDAGFVSNPGHTALWHTHLVGTLSQLYPNGSTDHFVLRSNDVHYYLTEEELHKLSNAHLVATGMNYDHCWPTRYRYPWGNGNYRIFPDTTLPSDSELAYYRIQVETGGSGASSGYDHPLNNIANPHKILDLGWCSIVTYSGPASNVQFNRVIGPRYENVRLAPQDQYFSRTCSKVSPELVRGSALQDLRRLDDKPILEYVSKINALLSCPSESLVSQRLDAILNVCGSHASTSYNFVDSDTPWYRRLLGLTRVWTLAKTEGVSPPPTWHIPLPEFFFGKHRGFIEKECTRFKFTERQLHVAHFGAIESLPKKSNENCEQIMFRKKISDPLRIENSDLTVDQKKRPYTHWLSLEETKKPKNLRHKLVHREDKETQGSGQPPTQASNMIPLHIETRPFHKSQLQLNDSSDNIHNVHLVQVLSSNIDWNEKAQPQVRFYPSIGYSPANHSLRPISTWTIDHKSPFSLLSAIHGRHFLPKITPDPKDLREFDAFVDIHMKPITDRVCLLLDNMEITETIMEHYMAKDYDANKKDCYIRMCMSQLSDPMNSDFSFSFLGMVKSNEENYTSKELRRDENGRLTDVDERARLIWNPSETGKGLLNYIQSFIFTALHDAFPDFVHGASCSDTRDLVLERVGALDDPISVSLDGSGYDSTQFASLQEIVDTRFFHSIRNSLHSILLKATRFHHLPDWTEEATDKLILSATSPDATLFIIYPKKWLEEYKMSKADSTLFSKHWPTSRPRSGQAVCSYKVSGTTFSGHPTKTTLGNTLRSLFYYRFAFRKFVKPVQMLASGDDIVIWTERAERDKIVEAVRKIASQTSTLQIHGLGQIVKKIEIKEKFDLEFCSKMFFSSPSTPLVVTRDLEKLMKTKLCASSSYVPFVLDPGLFMQSLYESALSEIPCPFILELLRHRLYQNPPKGSLTELALFRAKILSKGFFKKSKYHDWQSICHDPDIQEQMIARTNVFRPDVIDYVLQHNQVVRFGGIETLGSEKPLSCSSIKSTSTIMNRRNNNNNNGNRGRKQAGRSFYYEAYIPNPGQGVEVKVIDNPDHSQRKTELEISANKTFTDQNGSCHVTLNPADLSALESKIHEASRLSASNRSHLSTTESSQTVRRPSTRPNPGANRSMQILTQADGNLLSSRALKKAYDGNGAGNSSQRSSSRRNAANLNNSISKILTGELVARDTPKAFSNASNEFAFQGGAMINPPNYQQQLKDNKVRHMNRAARLNYYSANPMAGTLAPFTNNGPFIQDSVDLALSDTDRFMLAKYFPGRIDTPYMNGLTRIPIPTSRFSSSFSLTTCATSTGLDTITSPLGTFDFLMLAYCPALTLSVGSGVPFAQSTITHLSGLQAVQGNLSDTILFANGFDRTNRAPSLLTLLGTNFDSFSTNGVVFASELDMRILTPQANLVGTMYTGCCTLASIPPTGLSMQRLIQTSSKIMSGVPSFKMRGALVNNALATTALTPNANDVFADYSNEVVHYVILQTPVISITTGNPAKYTLICNGHGNYAYWPSQTDAFANKLGTSSAITADTGPSKFDKLNYDPTLAGLDEKSSQLGTGGMSFLEDASSFLENSFEAVKTIGDISAHAAPFLSLLASPTPKNGGTLVEKAWALRWIDQVQSASETCGMEWICEGLKAMAEGLAKMRLLVDEWPSPLVPSSLLMMAESREEDEFTKVGSNSKPFADMKRPALQQNETNVSAGTRPI